ncbi:MAG: NAD(P)H-hydrate dehydratase [Balneolaceae bacterium]|nr:NAD(P)H-hydrate dehydratase [Balneolaceae bacterium]
MNNALSAPHTHYVCTAGQSQQMDRSTIEEFGIDGYTLMEVAGSSAAKKLLDLLPSGSHGVYLCGKGNNAGDALVVARYLIQHGHRGTLVFLSGNDSLSPDTEKNYSLLTEIADKDDTAAGLRVYESWDDFEPEQLPPFSFIVDGMLGTGLDSDLRGDYTKAVSWANASGLPIYAIDIPTGLHSDTGAVMGEAVRATETFTFGSLKLGFYLDNGYQYSGKVTLCELPFPNFLKSCNTFLLDRDWLPEPGYKPAKHKYDAGVLYIIAGSEGLTGAAIMAARSAWAEGIGAVIVICPRGILQVFENNLPQIIKKPVGTTGDYHLKPEHLDDILDIIKDKEGHVLFGPGIGRTPETIEFSTAFMKEYEGPLLIDADALWSLARRKNWSKPPGATWILTPHPGELSRLIPDLGNSPAERLEAVRDTSIEKDIILVSKGFPTMIGTPTGDCFLTGYDTRIFARAGCGDVLAGKIGAYWAMGAPASKSAALALLNGYDSIQSNDVNNQRLPEPNDLI